MISRAKSAVAGAALCLAVASGLIFTGAAQAEQMSLGHFTVHSINENKSENTGAGAHPWENVSSFRFNEPMPEILKDAAVTLTPGFFGNPAAAPRCRAENIGAVDAFTHCPAGSKLGLTQLFFNRTAGGEGGGNTVQSIYNIYPEKGYPAQFGFNVAGQQVAVLSVIPLARTEGYGLTLGAKQLITLGISGLDVTFYGVPAEHGSGTTDSPFLTNPVVCSDPEPKWGFVGDSWNNAALLLPDGQPNLADPNWVIGSFAGPPVTGCNEPLLAGQFNPSLETKALQGGGPTQADQPTGLGVDFTFPQSNDPTNPETNFEPAAPQAPEPKDITVKLPAGLSINPSSADGLGACSDQASDPAGDQVHYDTTQPVTCPNSSIVGTAVALSPLLASHDPITDEVNGPEPIPGTVYLLKPHPGDLVNGQDGKFRLLIQLENAEAGVNFKLPGVAVADKQTGQLTATFTENPQLPSSSLEVNLNSGPRASLATPVTCGKFGTTSDLVPWSAPSATTPGTPDAHPSASFTVGAGPNGTACTTSPAGRPFAPALSAGTENPKAGSTSPFVLKLSRNDGEQELSSLNLTMPPGFAAKLAGVPYCPEAAIAAAATKSGAAEQASPSCPAASQVGTVTVGAGAGTNPYYTQGKAYLAGPYKGAPVSLVFITPAVAGPFDLGDVVVRAATFVNSATTQVSVATDPLPTILDGVPLRLRSLTARIDRPNFTLNPTNCSPLAVKATVGSSNGAVASPTSHFQASNCKALSFKPSLSLALKGGTKRSDNPALTATVTYPKGPNANIAFTSVLLPHSEFLDNAHIRNPCTRVVFAEGATPGERCPAASVIGFAKAETPLLEKPLEGPVYLRSSSHKLPDIVAALNGQFFVELDGRVDSVNERLRTTFESVPDAPVSKFTLGLYGGKKGLLVNSENLCRGPQIATVKMTAQNGMLNNIKPVISNGCKKPKKSSGHHGGHR